MVNIRKEEENICVKNYVEIIKRFPQKTCLNIHSGTLSTHLLYHSIHSLLAYIKEDLVDRMGSYCDLCGM